MRRPLARSAEAIWRAGVAAVDGYAAVARSLAASADTERPDRILAVGKAAAAMTRSALDHYGPVPALVVTKDGHGADLPGSIDLIEASHPVPDARSLTAGRTLRQAVEAMPEGSALLLLVSGGASALAEDPAGNLGLEELIERNRALLASGQDITAMNAQRRQWSRIKGGGLLEHFRGRRAVTLAISDVPQDDIAVIGSGIGDFGGERRFDYSAQIVASNAHARAAAAAEAEARGLSVLANEETLYGDVSVLARSLGSRLRAMPAGVIILGGEPTVVLPPDPGQGGRNQALALELAREIAGIADLVVVVGGTDGTDGPTDAAGGIVDGRTWAAGGKAALKRADSGSFLEARGALLRTGPTGTNVMDLMIAQRA